MDECDLENCDEEDFGSIEMNMVKQMIGLKISENDKEGHMNKSGEAAKGNNVLLNTNQIFDFKHPSTKVKINFLSQTKKKYLFKTKLTERVFHIFSARKPLRS